MAKGSHVLDDKNYRLFDLMVFDDPHNPFESLLLKCVSLFISFSEVIAKVSRLVLVLVGESLIS